MSTFLPFFSIVGCAVLSVVHLCYFFDPKIKGKFKFICFFLSVLSCVCAFWVIIYETI